MTKSIISPKPQLNRAGKKRVVVVFGSLSVIYTLMYIAAGSLNWPASWGYIGASALNILTFGIWAMHKNPEIVNERGRKPTNTRRWDKIFAIVFTPMLPLMPIIAGLDFRFDWSSVPTAVYVIGYIGFIPGLILPYLAMAENRFLTTTVRIQKDRGHHVISTGPYAYVRHPMYTGAMLTYLCSPLVLGSWWALIPGGIAILSMTIRTALEDKTLQNELPGYAEYTKRTRYRLVPGIW
ncbi:MAG: isoprenylcysteine carboxylmethyltransferase family protein [Chloroflexi bacterium]|nr:isoprenylcysteine carboxylmethyltransferase family protein [Chloroflexota bacterium]